ncbi:protein sld2 [Aspergillus undulatus]|uniref:protein sld2 n=1 Tax=Aspergillus undulatus TaxID=1810928 RepID=UPI003CCD9433
MATAVAPEIPSHAAALRAELKEWERAFAAANGGKKAGRGDIKREPEIAAKYKEYSRLKVQEDKNEKPKDADANIGERERERSRSKKRKHSSPNGPESTHTHPPNPTISTPRKPNTSIFQTPSKTRTTTTAHPSNLDPYDSPSVLRRLFSPSTHMQQQPESQSSSPLKTAIGPTPQRDGKALGLFDLLSESGGSTATPSATRMASIKGMDDVTPSKSKMKKRKTMAMGMDTIAEEDEEGEEEEEETARLERTPASSGKKFMLSALFATPTAWRYSSIVEDEARSTDNANAASQHQSQNQNQNESPRAETTSNSHLETPSFLRRSSSNLYSTNPTSNTSGLSPIPIRKPPLFPGPGRGLSQIVQGLRDMEEERMDDEMDVLREMENEQLGGGGDAGVDVPDSQMGMGLENMRTFKKKGQKRTTRLVKMKPVVAAKPKTTATMSQSQSQTQIQSKPRSQSQKHPVQHSKGDGEDEAETHEDDELVAVPETQALGDVHGKDEDDWDSTSLHSISEAEDDSDAGSDYDPNNNGPSKKTNLGRSKSFSEKMKEALGDSHEKKQPLGRRVPGKEEKENKKPASAPRKYNPNAHSHANYRSLKIRNRGGGRNFGRFRRR